MNDIEAHAARRFAVPEAPEPSTYDSAVTTDLRPAAFDELKAENTTLATELEQAQGLNAELAEENANLKEALRLQDEDTARLSRQVDDLLQARRDSATRIAELERERSALATELGAKLACLRELVDHMNADHEAMDRARERLDNQAEEIRRLDNQRAELTEALSKSSDLVLSTIGERDEARRIVDRFTERPEPLRFIQGEVTEEPSSIVARAASERVFRDGE